MKAYLFFFLLVVFKSMGQDTLTYDEFQEIVISNHPLIEKAELLDRVSRGQHMEARSLLDPYLKAGFTRKEFDNKTYYDSREVKFIVPTKYGLNFEADFQKNEGEFLNNREFLPESGLLSAGISMPIIRGLFFDERRQALRNADLLQDLNENEKRLLINDLLSKAAETYVIWQIAQEKMQVAQEGYDLAKLRESMIVKSFQSGEMAAIDTLEASVNRQNRQQRWKKAILEFEKAKVKLSSFLWDSEGNLGFINDEVYPELLTDAFLKEKINKELINFQELALNHPKIENQGLKIEQLGLKKRLARENQKPQLDLKLKPHTSEMNNNEFYDFNTDDYSVGFDFSLPIFNREYRAKSKLLAVEIESQEMQRNNDRVKLQNELFIMKRSEELLGEQLQLLRQNNDALRRLLNAEQVKFNIGESSLFIVNSRETKLLESREKELDLRQRFFENRIDFFFNSFLE